MSSRKRIGRYEILRELGRGAMGVVFKARDPYIGRLVALKTIHASVAEDPDLMERFYQEAIAAGGLQHPNVITIYEMAEAGGVPFIAMEYLEGQNLEQLISSKAPLTIAQKLGFLVQTCQALDYAHRRGVIHRDIKPGNIMLAADGTIKVVDFGIARLADTSKTQTGTILGTFGYMSPQQFHGKHADARSDVWSAGTVLYELLTYHKAFSGDNHASLLMSILHEEPTPVSELAPECPEGLERIVQKSLRKDDSERYQSMEALLLELEPVWVAERDKTAEMLLQGARNLLVKRRLDQARESLNQCLQVDRSNVTAKGLLEEVNALLGETGSAERVRQHVAKGEALLKEGLFAEARVQAESAMQLAPRDTAALGLLEKVKEQQSRARQDQAREKRLIDGQMRTMRASIERGDLTGAVELGKATLAQVGADQGLSQLVRFAERERQARETKAQADTQVRKIVTLLKQGDFAKARNAIQSLQDDAPLDPRIAPLLAAASEQRVLSESSASAIIELEAPPEDVGKEYVFESASSSPVVQAELDQADSAVTVVRFPASGTALPGKSSSKPAPQPASPTGESTPVPLRSRPKPANVEIAPNQRPNRAALYLVATVVALTSAGVWTYRHFAANSKSAPANSAANVTTAAPPQPVQVPVQDQQVQLIDLAHQAADAGDYSTAQARLDEAEKLNGPLQARIADLRDQFGREEQDKGLQQIAEQERPLWDEAMKDINANRLDVAEQSFRKILALPAGGRRRGDAERYVNEVIPARRQEEALWIRAGELSQSREKTQLEEGIRLLDKLAGSGGRHAEEAQRLREKTIQQLAGIESAAQISDSSRDRFARLENDFRRAKQQGDAASVVQLRSLQDEFRGIAQAGGPMASGATDYENNVIPATIKQIEDRLAATDAQARANTQFDDAVNRYNQAVAAKDSTALKSQVLPAFQAIARGGGIKAADAARYVNSLIPEALQNLKPWPAIGCVAAPVGLEQSITPGELVACGLLDPPKLTWTEFQWPPFPTRASQAGLEKGLAMLSLTVDPDGNVLDARPRGPSDSHGFTDSALSAAKQWKTTPPRAQGKPVRTQFSVDIPFTP